MTTRWSEEKTLKFVQLYRDNTNLWNMFSSEYRNREGRSASMQSIVDEMNIPNFTVKDVPKKIKALRSTYYLELAKIEKRNGEGSDFVYKPSLPWFDVMDYIMKTVNANFKEKETCGISEIGTQVKPEAQDDPNTSMNSNSQEFFDDDFDEMSDPLWTEEQPVSKTLQQPIRYSGQKRRFEALTHAVRDLKDLNEKKGTSTASTSVGKEDECDIMGKHVAIQLRELPLHDRLLANFEIQKILTDFRLRNINPVSARPLSAMTYSSASSILDISNPCTP